MKITFLFLGWAIILLLIGRIIMSMRPISKMKAQKIIQTLLKKEVNRKDTISSVLVYVNSPKHNFEAYFAVGVENKEKVDVDQPFHVASVGKAFTATLVGNLMDEGKVQLSDKVIDHLDPSMLEGLFVYDQTDYKDQITVEMLLNHTSGIGDYFEEPGVDGRKIIDKVIDEPDHFFKAEELIEFTRNHQKSVGKPGQGFHYSDTGYILLGLLIEAISGLKFHEMLSQKIFEPLNMDDSYMMFYSKPKNNERPIADLWLNGYEVSGYTSLSVDWTGGGIISTLKDLSVFVEALNGGALLSKETLDRLYQFNHVFRRGIHYGNGFMSFHFGEFFPTLKALPNLKGHMGILGSQMLYDENTKTSYVCSFGSSDYSARSVRVMIQILSQINRIKK